MLPWSAFSPDLRPIEHLFDQLGHRVCERENPHHTSQELLDALREELNRITQKAYRRWSGEDPENIEPGGANSIKYQTEPGGANLIFGITYKGEGGGGVRRMLVDSDIVRETLSLLCYG